MRCHLRCVFAGLFLAMLSGCGSPPPPPPSAAKDIEEAERALDSAKGWKAKGQIDLAIGEYRKAKDAISKGKLIAEGNERDNLKSMEDDVRRNLTDLETKKLTMAAAPPKPAVAAAGPKTEDPGEKRKREEDAKKQKEQDEAAKKTADMSKKLAETAAAPKAAASAKKDEDAEAEEIAAVAAANKKLAAKTGGKGADKAGGEDAAAGKDGEGDGGGAAPIKKASGPYPAITEKSPEVEVCKLAVKGNTCIAYIQLYNKTDTGKRIMSVNVFFNNANHQPVIAPPRSMAFQQDGFKPDAADPTDQSCPAVTQGSHQITGFDGLRVVGVGQHDQAGSVKEVVVTVIFSDDTKWRGSGPAAAAEAQDTIRGLKLK